MKNKKQSTKRESQLETIFWEKTSKGKKEPGVHVSFIGLGRDATPSEVEWLHERIIKKGFLLCQVGVNDYLIVSAITRAGSKKVHKSFPKGRVQ